MKKLLHRLLMMTKLSLYGLILQLFLSPALFAVDSNAQNSMNLKEVRISLKFNDVTLEEALALLEVKSGFSFTYNKLDLQDIKLKGNYNNQSLYKVLMNISKQAQVQFKQVNRNITVKNLETELQNEGERISMEAQQITVTGKVTSLENNEGLPGANVVEKGTLNGTVTDIDGNYRLIVSPDATLIFSSVGYTTEEVAVNNRSVVNVGMAQDIKTLQELVVIGYGTRDKKDVTTAISSISSEEVTKSIAMSPELSMQGRMSGVQVSGVSGNPMARPTIRIRGVGTWGVADPLYVIDGIPVTEYGAGIEGQIDARASDVRGPLNIMSLIDPNEIESISVLKDASAAAIYGVRAANGVVLITTKKGRKDTPTVEFTTRYGIQNITQHIDVLNTQQYVNHVNKVYSSDPSIEVAPENEGIFDQGDERYLGNSPTYDWQTALKNKNAPTADYNLNISGGTDKTDYFLSAGYSAMEGTLIANELQRYSGSFKVNTNLNKFIRAGVNYRITSAIGKDNSFRVTFWEAAQTPPWQPIYDPNGPNGYASTVLGIGEDGIYRSTKKYGTGTRLNLPGLLNTNDTDYNSLRNMGSAYVEIEPLKNLKIKGQISLDKYTTNRYEFEDYRSAVFNYTAGDPRGRGDGYSVGNYGERDVYNTNLVKEIIANYNTSIGDHNIDLLFSAMEQHYDWKYTGMSTENMSSISPDLRRLGGENKYTNVGSDFGRNALAGLLGRIGYNYSSKYYLDLTLRRDGSNRFAPENHWGYFPAVSAAWRLTTEPFMQSVTFIDDFKIRAGWGELGNQEVRPFAYLSPIATNPTFAWGNTTGENLGYGNFFTAATVFGLPNRELQWEKSATTNIGFDAVFLTSLNLSFEYYNKLTEGLLLETALPSSVGLVNQPVANIGSVRNSGIEISLNYSNNFGKLNYSVGGNLTTVKNEVEKTFNNIPIGENIEVGYPLYYARGYKVAGIFQSQQEIDEWKQNYSDSDYELAKVAPGDFYFQDLRGAPENPGEFYSEGPDGKIDHYDRVYLGKTIPGHYYGINMNLEYSGFDLGLQFTGVGDVVKYNDVKASLEYTPGTGNNLSTSIFNSWTPENPNTSMPRIIGGDPANNFRRSDYFIENASYLRLGYVQLGYSLPESFYEFTKNNIKSARIYIGSSNLFTLSGYSGLDPESDKYPTPRVFFGGLNVRF